MPLIMTILVGFVLVGCNSQEQPPAPTSDQIGALPLTASLTPGQNRSPEATVTAAPRLIDTDTPIPASPTIPPSATAVPTEVETEGPKLGTTRISDVDQMEQVYVPSGEFIMGAEDFYARRTTEGGRAYPELPVNTLFLEAYWIDKYEVTNSQYGLCLKAGACPEVHLSSSETRSDYFGNPEFSNYPVIWVTWHMARAYCEWAGRRLPTEAEWEKAARGTDGRMYPWGNEPLSGEKANFCDINCPRTIANPNYDDGYADTSPVGSYSDGASPFGAMDMAGNVWEWTSTLIQPYPYNADDGREDQEVWGERVWRGGPWSNGTWWMRSSLRYRSSPDYWGVNLGFRCASSE